MPELLSAASELAGDAVEAVRGVFIRDDQYAPVERPCLPGQDPDPSEREKWLADARTRYQWDYTYLEGMALLFEGDTQDPSLVQALTPRDHLPLEAKPPVDYIPLRAASLTELALSSVRERFAEGLVADTGHVQDLATYNDIVRAPLKLPQTCERWHEDRVFAWQRLAGVNPLIIQGITALPKHHLHLTDDDLRGVWRDGLVLADELAAGNIYMTDYTILDQVSTKSDDHGTRQVWPVVALFHVDRSHDENAPLMPLAIQLGMPRPSDVDPEVKIPDPGLLLTPNDGVRWTIAKVAHQCADITLHEMGTHLGRAHFGLEALIVAAFRHMSHRHPLMVLFQPHFRIVLFNNFEGRELLVNPGGKVDMLMAGGVKSELGLVMTSVEGDTDDTDGSPQTMHWSFDHFDLHTDLEARKVDGLKHHYPYADDGRLVWDAIHTFVSEYLDLYYDSDLAVADDPELQGWLKALVGDEAAYNAWLEDVKANPAKQNDRHDFGGLMRGIPEVHTKAALARVCTRIIFASGPQHSAINFAQYECAASALNMPLALYEDLPRNLKDWTDEHAEAFLRQMLPPIEQAKSQLGTIVELTSFHYDQLGHYKEGDFKDPLVEPLIERFQERLAAIDVEVDRRNSTRFLPYTFMQPKHILNSASI